MEPKLAFLLKMLFMLIALHCVMFILSDADVKGTIVALGGKKDGEDGMIYIMVEAGGIRSPRKPAALCHVDALEVRWLQRQSILPLTAAKWVDDYMLLSTDAVSR